MRADRRGRGRGRGHGVHKRQEVGEDHRSLADALNHGPVTGPAQGGVPAESADRLTISWPTLVERNRKVLREQYGHYASISAVGSRSRPAAFPSPYAIRRNLLTTAHRLQARRQSGTHTPPQSTARRKAGPCQRSPGRPPTSRT